MLPWLKFFSAWLESLVQKKLSFSLRRQFFSFSHQLIIRHSSFYDSWKYCRKIFYRRSKIESEHQKVIYANSVLIRIFWLYVESIGMLDHHLEPNNERPGYFSYVYPSNYTLYQQGTSEPVIELDWARTYPASNLDGLYFSGASFVNLHQIKWQAHIPLNKFKLHPGPLLSILTCAISSQDWS